ncbi:MAG TPA: hypothetical protein VGK30_12100 [Candidatus Binatia bacterium]|jgi:hypothetical protein
MRILALTLGLMMLAAVGSAQDGSGGHWSRAGCLGRCGADLERCTRQRFGKMAAKDCQVEELHCHKACNALAYLGDPTDSPGPLEWSNFFTLETSRLLLVR